MDLFNFYIPEWFFVAFSLLVLVFVLRKILWKPVNKILDERQEKITTALKDADDIEAEKRGMDVRRAELEAEMNNYTAEQMKDARVRAGKEYDRIVAEAEEKSRAILLSARTQAEREREGIFREARSELVAAALEAAGALLGARMDEEANERLIESVLFRKGGRV